MEEKQDQLSSDSTGNKNLSTAGISNFSSAEINSLGQTMSQGMDFSNLSLNTEDSSSGGFLERADGLFPTNVTSSFGNSKVAYDNVEVYNNDKVNNNNNNNSSIDNSNNKSNDKSSSMDLDLNKRAKSRKQRSSKPNGGVKRKAVQPIARDDEEDSFASMSLDDYSKTDNSELSRVEAMYLILRNHMSEREAEKFAVIFLQHPEYSSDITRMCVVGKGSDFGTLRDSIKKQLPDTFNNLHSRITASVRGRIKNYYDFVKDLMSKIPYCDITDQGYIECGGVRLCVLTRHAYEFNQINIEAYGKLFRLDTSDYDNNPTKFQFILFLVSNGRFSIDNGQVVYRLKELPVGRAPAYDKFVIPANVAGLRRSMADLINNKLRNESVSSLSYDSISSIYVKGLDSAVSQIAKGVNEFYVNHFVPGNYKYILNDINRFVQHNKQWRKQTEKWFLPTPEFDYYNAAVCLYPRDYRNKLSGIKDAIDDKQVTDNQKMYNLFNSDVSDVNITSFKRLYLQFSISSDWIEKMGKVSCAYSAVQNHSLMTVAVPSVKASLDDNARAWLMQGIRIARGEYDYMLAMLMGKFRYTGKIEAVKAITDYTPKTNKLNSYF